MGREEVIERAGEGERILGKREEDKRKERGERERMDRRTDGWMDRRGATLSSGPPPRPLPPRLEFSQPV